MKTFEYLLIVVFILLLSPLSVKAQSTDVSGGFPLIDGIVDVVKSQNDRIYIGGRFSYIGDHTGRAGMATLSTNTPVDFPEVLGSSIQKEISDRNGGFYIAGNFYSVGGVMVSNLAHILPDGTVDTQWKPHVNGTVYDIKLNSDGSVLYLAGEFTQIEGIDRPYVAAIETDISTVPACTVTRTAIEEGFEGSTFPPSDWTTRNVAWGLSTDAYEGSQSAQSAFVTSNTSTLETTVTLADHGILEFFWKVSSRANYAFLYYCIDKPSCTQNLDYVERISGTVGWSKKQISLSPGEHTLTWKYTNSLASSTGSNRGWLDKVTLTEYEVYPCGNAALVTDWNPQPNNLVRKIEISTDDDRIYIGGSFTTIGGVSRTLLAGLNVDGTLIEDFNPILSTTNASVYELKLSPNEESLYLGGYRITTVNSIGRNNIAKIETSTGALEGWNPVLTGNTLDYVSNIYIDNNEIWLGGRFQNLNGAEQFNIAVVDDLIGNSLGFKSPFSRFQYPVHAIEMTGDKIFILNASATIQGDSRSRLLIYDRNTKTQTNITPVGFNGTAQTIVLEESNDRYLLGGTFSSFGGYIRNGLAALDIDTREVLDWDPQLNAGARIYDIEIDGSRVYIGGFFNQIAGISRNNLAQLNACNGVLYEWDPDIKSGAVETLAFNSDRSVLYAGGTFLYVGNEKVNRLASFTTIDLQKTSWSPSASDSVKDIKIYGDTVYLAGSFDVISGEQRKLIAAVDTTNGHLTDFNPVIPYNNYLISYSIAVTSNGDRVFVGGPFYYSYLLGYNTNDSSRITLPNLSGNDSIYQISIDETDSLLYMAGAYRTGIRTLNLNTNQLTGWGFQLTSGNNIYGLEVKDSNIIITGSLSGIGGVSVNNIAQIGSYINNDPVMDCSILPEQPSPPIIPDPQDKIVYPDVVLNEIDFLLPQSTFSNPDNTPNFKSIVGVTGDVRSIIGYDDMVYVGGSFGQVVGRATGYAVPIDKNLDDVIEGDFPVLYVVDGPTYYGLVNHILPDGDGGWYIGGYFDRANEQVVSNLIHVLPDGTVNPDFLPTFGGTYSTDIGRMALSPDKNTLYVGGSFTSVNGVARNRLCSFDLTNYSLTSWNPNANSWINTVALSPDGSLLYVGGNFTTMGGVTRNRLAAFNTTSGALDSWNPNVSGGVVSAITIDPTGSTIFAGGAFTTVGGTSRPYLVALNTSGGIISTFTPTVSSSLRAIELNDDHIYIGGNFNTVNGQTRQGIARMNSSGELDTDWHAVLDGVVYGIHVDDGYVYINGYFSNVNGKQRSRLVAVNTITGATIDSFTMQVDTYNGTLTVATFEDIVYVGGYHTLVGHWINNLMRIKPDGRVDKDFVYDMNGEIITMVAHQDILYIGGEFTSVNGIPRNYAAAIDIRTGEVTDWNPHFDEWVNGMAIAGDTLYCGGFFSRVNGVDRVGIVAFNDGSDIPSEWTVELTGVQWPYVNAIYPLGNKILIGGYFDHEDKTNLISVDPISGEVDDWSPNPNQEVYTFNSDHERLYVGGAFTYINGSPNNYLAVYDLHNDMTPIDLGLNLDGDVYAIQVTQNSLFLGGLFYNTNQYLIEVDLNQPLSPATITSWYPEPDWGAYTLYVTDETLFIGGDMYYFGRIEAMGYIVQFGQLPSQTKTPTIEFGYVNHILYENSGTNYIKVMLQDAVSDVDISVSYTITGGTANTSDYLITDGVVIIPAGSFSANIPITLVDNELEDGHRTIFLKLFDPTSVELGKYNATTITIIDDETIANPQQGGDDDGGDQEDGDDQQTPSEDLKDEQTQDDDTTADTTGDTTAQDSEITAQRQPLPIFDTRTQDLVSTEQDDGVSEYIENQIYNDTDESMEEDNKTIPPRIQMKDGYPTRRTYNWCILPIIILIILMFFLIYLKKKEEKRSKGIK